MKVGQLIGEPRGQRMSVGRFGNEECSGREVKSAQVIAVRVNVSRLVGITHKD